MISAKEATILLSHALVGWAYCGSLMFGGQQFFTMETTLIIHAFGAPIGFGLLSWLYHARFGYTRPLVTASVFVGFALVMDLFVVAMLIEKSFAMFTTLIGVWIPLGLGFIATHIVGCAVARAR